MKLILSLIVFAGLLLAQPTVVFTTGTGTVTATVTDPGNGGQMVCKFALNTQISKPPSFPNGTQPVTTACAYSSNGVGVSVANWFDWIIPDAQVWTQGNALFYGLNAAWYLYSFSWEPGEVYYLIIAQGQAKFGTF